MTEKNEKNEYQEAGFKNRSEYLQSLSDEYGVSIQTVSAAADLLGPNEDFDGLANALEDLEDEGFDFIMKYKATNIVYDLSDSEYSDESPESLSLPKEITFDIDPGDDEEDFDPAYELADYISDKTGFCVVSFDWEC